MSPMIAFCGLDCAACPAYVATQANDIAAQERILAQWRTEFHAPDMPFEAVICDGCTPAEGRHGGYCHDCGVRACAVERGVENCAHCDDYGCDKLMAFIGNVPQMRDTLEAIRRSLVN